MNESIFEKYGGYNTFYKCVVDLYKELVDHPEISFHFIGVNIERLSHLQTQALSNLLGGNLDYEGRPLRPAHSDLGITNYQFDIVIRFFRYVFEDNHFEEKDIKKIIKLLKTQRKIIVTKKSSLIDEIVRPFYNFIDFCLKRVGKRRL